MAVSSKNSRQGRYKVRNWREYNESLVRRGDITFWFAEDVLEAWEHDNAEWKVGRPYVYSDLAIEALLTLRELFQLPYRQTEGLGQSLASLMQANIAIPDFTSLQKRAAKLRLAKRIEVTASGPVHVVVDSTGLKIYSAGEWQERWHLAIDPNTQEIIAQVLTTGHVGDATQVAPLLGQIEAPVEKFYGDGAYDAARVYQALSQRQITPIIPPQRGAKLQQHGNCAATPLPRDENIRGIRRLGRAAWKRHVGYHRRSLVETAFWRLKRSFGENLKNRHLPNQRTETILRCKLLNHFTRLGMPNSFGAVSRQGACEACRCPQVTG